jgi:hypothetical protein
MKNKSIFQIIQMYKTKHDVNTKAMKIRMLKWKGKSKINLGRKKMQYA